MGLFRILFSKYKYLVHTTFGSKNYYEAVYKLKENGISYETVIKRSQNAISNLNNSNLNQSENAQYEIYVKEEDNHKAQHAIHK
ncbi:hypothetical protein BBI11_12775 [Planococcus maritimus]|uniref:hypothetical protein n=1 Tax=Planococcus maritimus TaxID=192421 RepID=UPI00080F1C66|nr:hypothetical protein [Planococcus maritimus]ANU17853.1 hypothetical protein BBI11_12775 [Planococcus maritimus]